MPKTIPLNSSQNAQILSLPSEFMAQSWQQQLAQAVTEPSQLLALLGVEAGAFAGYPSKDMPFAMKVPRAYIKKMRYGQADDPLLLQVMTQAAEQVSVPGYRHDPVGDLRAGKAPGLIHKYHGRVLLITTGACAIHCRYCFRRHFPYASQQAGRDQWQQALAYIREDKTIDEVILSGGDPLTLSDSRLEGLMDELESVAHLSRLRIHTRLPLVIPARITTALLQRLQSSRLDICMVIHANHANEITQPEVQVLQSLRRAGVHLLNQAVLLKGINERLEQQLDLCNTLYRAGVLPYYLHLLDPVEGAAHFDTRLEHARELHRQMRRYLPGYLLPDLVKEVAGEPSKTPADEL